MVTCYGSMWCQCVMVICDCNGKRVDPWTIIKSKMDGNCEAHSASNCTEVQNCTVLHSIALEGDCKAQGLIEVLTVHYCTDFAPLCTSCVFLHNSSLWTEIYVNYNSSLWSERLTVKFVTLDAGALTIAAMPKGCVTLLFIFTLKLSWDLRLFLFKLSGVRTPTSPSCPSLWCRQAGRLSSRQASPSSTTQPRSIFWPHCHRFYRHISS